MAIRFSPGCGCCLGKCEETTLQWIPSSPYDRGEYTDDDRWRPFTEYLQGDQFWEFALDRNGDTHKFLFTAPATMMSGGGWTLTEEARYNRGRGISYADGLQDFELLTNATDEAYGFPLDQIRLHEALQQRRLYEGQGLISRREIAKEEWIATWNVEVKSTEEYPDMAMESLDVLIKFMGSAEYDSAVDDYPTSGIVTVVSKAAPEERVTAPYPAECIPVCEAEAEEFWNPGDPQCGPKAPFNPEWKIEHGTFDSGGETLDNTYAKRDKLLQVKNARSTQPENATVMGFINVPNQAMFGGREAGEPLNLHDYTVLNECFSAGGDAGAGFAEGFEDHRIQNAVSVITEGGMVTQGGEPFMVEAGDIIQITDFTKLDCDPFADEHFRGTADFPEDGAFTHIPAAEIVEHDRTCFLSSDTTAIKDNDIDVAKSLFAFSGGKLAVYVDKFSDTDFQRTRNGEYYCEFALNMCRVETPASITHPECEPIPAYECDCRPLRAILQGADLANIASYDSCHLENMMSGIIDESFQFMFALDAFGGRLATLVPLDTSDGIEWMPSVFQVPGGSGDCYASAANATVAQTWTFYRMQDDSSILGGREVAGLGYGWRIRTTAIAEIAKIKLFDCIGRRDKVVMARSVVATSGFTIDQGAIGDFSRTIYLDEGLARAKFEQARGRALNDAAKYANGYLCNGGGLSDSMIFGSPFRIAPSTVREIDFDNDGDIDGVIFGADSHFVAASLHEWSLQTDPGVGCGYAVSVDYPTWDEQENQQRAGRHFSPITTCSLDAPATSFTGQTSTIASR
jgi:hypothetical protein